MEGDKSSNGGVYRRLSSSSAAKAFEEKIRRRKLERDGDGSKERKASKARQKARPGSGNRKAKHDKADHRQATRGLLRDDSCASLPTAIAVADTSEENSSDWWSPSMPGIFDSLNVAKEVAEAPAEWQARGDGQAAGANEVESNVKSNRIRLWGKGIRLGAKPAPAAVDQEARLEASGVGFEDIFSHLQRFNEENGTLTMPNSHPFFSHILNMLSAVGMEELLREHWDHQLAGLRAFKEKYGDCRVCEAHPTLGAWARIQGDHYVKYSRRLPSPLTKERYGKLKKLGFDEYVSWKRENKQQDIEDTKGSVGRGSLGSEEEKNSVDPRVLSLDEKIKKKKRQNKDKFVERALKAHHMSLPEDADKAEVADHMYKKRVLLRAARRGLGRKASAKVIAHTIRVDTLHGNQGTRHSSGVIAQKIADNSQSGMGLRTSSRVIPPTIREDEGPADGPVATSLGSGDRVTTPAHLTRSAPGCLEKIAEVYPLLRRSSSCTNLTPGSWECNNCSYVNEPVGMDSGSEACRSCGSWHCRKCTEFNPGALLRCGICNRPRELSRMRSKDDSDIDDWASLDSVFQETMARSRVETSRKPLARSVPLGVRF